MKYRHTFIPGISGVFHSQPMSAGTGYPGLRNGLHALWPIVLPGIQSYLYRDLNVFVLLLPFMPLLPENLGDT